MNRRFVTGLLPRVLLGAASIVSLLAGEAGARPILADASRELKVFPSPYAHYLVGRYAMAQGDVGTASAAMLAATAGDPEDADVREKAFLIALLNGDIDKAEAMSANYAPQSDTTELMVQVVGAVTDVRADRPSNALKSIDAALKLSPRDRTSAMMKPYVLAMSGQWKQAVDDKGDAAVDVNDSDNQLTIFVLKAERARIAEIRGHAAEAEALYEAVYKPGPASFIFGPDYAAFLERQGRKDEARIVWQTLADSGRDTNARRALQRLDAADYVSPALPDLKQSLAQALFLSSTLYYGNNSPEMALANLRLAIYLDPGSDRQRLFLGQIQQDLKSPEAAEAAWAAIAPNSPFYAEASLRRVGSLRDRDQNEDALKLLDQAMAGDPDNLGYTIEKASLLQADKDGKGALDAINERIQRAGDTDFTWQAWYLQAMVYESLDQWDNAETAIKKAQVLQPDQPEILNFLGYGWINRGTHVEEGIALIRKAMAMSPKSGAIVDSLGWGYYKLGDYANALTYVEQAVQMSPSDAEINEHLGDVYKALGRDIEAGYEWQRVLTLDVDPLVAERVRGKIDNNNDALRAKGALPEATSIKTTADAVVAPVRKKRGGFGRA